MIALCQLAWLALAQEGLRHWWAPTLWWVELVMQAAEPRRTAQIIDMQQWAREHPRAHSSGGHAA